MGKYDELISFIPQLQGDNFGEWVMDHTNDGSSEHPKHFSFVRYSKDVMDLIDTIYEFSNNHPEFELKNYRELLEKHGIEWGMGSMESADTSKLDGQTVMALLVGALRAERFSDGTLLEFLESGTILKWIERLKTISESE